MSDTQPTGAGSRPGATPSSLREAAARDHPDFPFLSADRPDDVGRWLEAGGWLEAGEAFGACGQAGDGNMNLTLRIRTNRRQLILKQARPWVEKYDHIAAPWDRSLFEQRFYQRVAPIPEVASRMPQLLGCDADARILLLEDLPGARDFTDLYTAAAERENGLALEDTPRIRDTEVDALCDYLAALHTETRGSPDAELANRAMRELNHAHLFVVPLDPENGLDLDGNEPGLAARARRLMGDDDYRRAVTGLGRRYLADGRCLVHGDYFPGSWLRCDAGIRVIDPEFAFYGDPELDLGVAVAHLALAAQPPDRAHRMLDRYGKAAGSFDVDEAVLTGYASVEVMRRLIGVAQLPIPATRIFRGELLDRSHEALRSRSIDLLFGGTTSR